MNITLGCLLLLLCHSEGFLRFLVLILLTLLCLLILLARSFLGLVRRLRIP